MSQSNNNEPTDQPLLAPQLPDNEPTDAQPLAEQSASNEPTEALPLVDALPDSQPVTDQATVSDNEPTVGELLPSQSADSPATDAVQTGQQLPRQSVPTERQSTDYSPDQPADDGDTTKRLIPAKIPAWAFANIEADVKAYNEANRGRNQYTVNSFAVELLTNQRKYHKAVAILPVLGEQLEQQDNQLLQLQEQLHTLRQAPAPQPAYPDQRDDVARLQATIDEKNAVLHTLTDQTKLAAAAYQKILADKEVTNAKWLDFIDELLTEIARKEIFPKKAKVKLLAIAQKLFDDKENATN